ncbi:MAG: DUF6986 family protein, partial [Janthinobacterium lividum]
MKLTEDDLAAVDAQLAASDAQRVAAYPGDRTDRQPVHTVYVPADRFVAQGGPDLPGAWGAEATAALARHAPRADDLARACDLDGEEVREVWGA